MLNAIREETLIELEKVVDVFSNDSNARILIITGVGDKAFCAGGDIKEIKKMTSKEAAEFARRAQRVLGKMENLMGYILNGTRTDRRRRKASGKRGRKTG